MKGDIQANLDKRGFVKIHLYADDIDAISESLGNSFQTCADLRNALVVSFGSKVRERAKMSESEKQHNSIMRIAERKGLNKADVEKALALLKLV